jgi:hypothetical protein
MSPPGRAVTTEVRLPTVPKPSHPVKVEALFQNEMYPVWFDGVAGSWRISAG